jgi:hypothetical protein
MGMLNESAFKEAWRAARIRCCATAIDDKKPPMRIVMFGEKDLRHSIEAYVNATNKIGRE